MKYIKNNLHKSLVSLVFIFTIGNLISSPAQIIQPGAPGNPSKILNAEEATAIANTS